MKTLVKTLSLIAAIIIGQTVVAQNDTSTVDLMSITTETDSATSTSKSKNTEYKSLFGNDTKAFGGYFGFNSHYSKINNQDALLLGVELTAVINHSFNIGVQGYGLVTPVETNRNTEFGDPLYLAVGYGGIKMEPVAFYNSAVHMSFPVLIGAGGVTEYSKNDYYGYYQPYYYEYNYDFFFVFEPGIELELNVLKFMRVSTGASYRLTSDFNIIGMENSNLNGFNFDLSLKFGWF